MSVQLIMISGASLLKKVKLLPLYDPCSYKMGQVIKKVVFKRALRHVCYFSWNFYPQTVEMCILYQMSMQFFKIQLKNFPPRLPTNWLG